MSIEWITGPDSRRGSVLMEYVVLTCLVSMVVLTFLHTKFYNAMDGYIDEGKVWSRVVQQLHRVVAFPVP